MTDHQPEGTRLAAQLGEAVGGPETPDPETPLADAEHRLGQVRENAESLLLNPDPVVQWCARQVLAVLGVPVPPLPPARARAVADLVAVEGAAAVLERRYPGTRPERLQDVLSELWAIGRAWRRQAAEAEDRSDDARVPRLCPTCLHDGVLERVLGRAEAAEAKLAATPEQMLREFHATKAIHGGLMPERPTTDIPAWVRDLRMALLDEEVEELREAVAKGDIVAIADALGDIEHVTRGTAVAYGIPSDAVFAEIFRSNMTKDNSPAEGKLVKGPGYEPPRVAEILAITGTEGDEGNG